MLSSLLLGCHWIIPYATSPSKDVRGDISSNWPTLDGTTTPDTGRDQLTARDGAKDGSIARDGALGETLANDGPRDAQVKDVKATLDTTGKKEGGANDASVPSDGATCLSSWVLWQPAKPCGTLSCCYSCSSSKVFTIQCNSTGTCSCFDGHLTKSCNGFPSCQAAWSGGCCMNL